MSWIALFPTTASTTDVVLIMKKVCIYVHMQFVYTVSLKKKFGECNQNLVMSALRESCSKAWGDDIMSTQTLLYGNLLMRKVSTCMFLIATRFFFVSKNFEDIFSCLNIHPNIKFQFILVILVTTYIMFLCFFSHAAVLEIHLATGDHVFSFFFLFVLEQREK